MILVTCKICKKKFKSYPSRKAIYCSRGCYFKDPGGIEKIRKGVLRAYEEGRLIGFQKGHKFYKGAEKGWFEKGQISPNKGRCYTEKEKQSIGEKTRIGMNKPEVKAKLRKPKTETHKEKLRKSMIKNWENPEYREQRVKERIEFWLNPEYRDKTIKATMKGNSMKPNKPEKLLIKLLNYILPNEYKYVGNGQFILGGKCPDFLNINGKKKLIEIFGEYWHGKRRTGIEPKENEENRVNHFKQFGFDTLIIWEKELKNLEKAKNRIIQFTNL